HHPVGQGEHPGGSARVGRPLRRGGAGGIGGQSDGLFQDGADRLRPARPPVPAELGGGRDRFWPPARGREKALGPLPSRFFLGESPGSMATIYRAWLFLQEHVVGTLAALTLVVVTVFAVSEMLTR